MKTLLTTVATLLSFAHAATITTFAALDSTSPTSTAAIGASGFTQPDNNQDFTFDFTMTTEATLETEHLLDFGGGNGMSLRLETDRIVFRSYTGTNMLYVESNPLSVSTFYRVTGSIFIDPAGNSDEMRLYLNEADAVNSGASNYQPVADLGSNGWRGGNAAGYGIVGGGDYLIGTPASPGNIGPSPENTSLFESQLDMYEGTFLAVIPEPSSIALLGLAGLAVFFFRRKK